MTSRRQLTTLDKLRIIVRQSVCPDCGGKIGSLKDCEFDHEHSLALGGADELDNLFAKHVDCHKAKTKRDAKARAKVRHITGPKAARFSGPPRGEDIGVEADADHAGVGRKKSWPARKMQSRGFEKRARS